MIIICLHCWAKTWQVGVIWWRWGWTNGSACRRCVLSVGAGDYFAFRQKSFQTRKHIFFIEVVCLKFVFLSLFCINGIKIASDVFLTLCACDTNARRCLRLSNRAWHPICWQVLGMMKTLFHKCNLVHADLSEYNLLWHEDKVWNSLLMLVFISRSLPLTISRTLWYRSTTVCYNRTLLSFKDRQSYCSGFWDEFSA